MIQESTCVDRLIDMLSKKKADKIEKIVNTVFHGKVPLNYIQTRIDEKLPIYRDALKRVKEIPIIKQRSPEWYAARHKIITASDFAEALGDGKFGTQRNFYQKKCGYEVKTFDPYTPPLKWGCMFEEVAGNIYTTRNKTSLYEFGLLLHPRVDFFGASPDGITENGIMLEIKCPYVRKITGEIPLQYQYQIQGQLDVCGLNECDYLECEFETIVPSFWDEYEAYPFEQGCIIEFTEYDEKKEPFPKYSYSPINLTKQELEKWQIENSLGSTKSHLWRLKKYNVIRVYRDDEFLKEKFQLLKHVWDNVERYRSDKACYDRETMSSRKTTKKEVGVKSIGHDESGGFSFR